MSRAVGAMGIEREEAALGLWLGLGRGEDASDRGLLGTRATWEKKSEIKKGNQSPKLKHDDGPLKKSRRLQSMTYELKKAHGSY
jgi:hypothetical protein